MHTAQRMPLPLTVSCFSKIQIGFSFLAQAHPGSPGQSAVTRVCVCVFVLDVEYLTAFGTLPVDQSTFEAASRAKQRCGLLL